MQTSLRSRCCPIKFLRDIQIGTPRCVCLFVENQIAAKWSLLDSMYPHVRYLKLARCKRDFPFFLE